MSLGAPTDPGTGRAPGEPHLVFPRRPQDPEDPPRDLPRELVGAADRIDRGDSEPEAKLSLEQAADAVLALATQGGVTADRIRDAERAIARAAEVEIAKSTTGGERLTAGSLSATVLMPRTHLTMLNDALKLFKQHEAARVEVERDPLLSDLGRQQRMAALNEKTLKATDALITSTSVLVDRHLTAARTRLEKSFATTAPPEPTDAERLRALLDRDAFARATADVPDQDFRRGVAELIKNRSIYASTALRAAAMRCVLKPEQIGSLVAMLDSEAAGIAVERMTQNSAQLRAACEWAALRRSQTRMAAECAALRKSLGAAEVFVNGWERDLSTVSPVPGPGVE